MNSLDSFQTLDSLKIGNKKFAFYNISKLNDQYPNIRKLPKSKKILIENLLSLEDGKDVNKNIIEKDYLNKSNMPKLKIIKAHGNYNDFIILLKQNIPNNILLNRDFIQKICKQENSVDGFVLLVALGQNLYR